MQTVKPPASCRQRRLWPWVTLVPCVLVGLLIWHQPWQRAQTSLGGPPGGAETAQTMSVATVAKGDIPLLFRPGPPPGPDLQRLQARIESLLSPSDRAAFHVAMQSGAPDVTPYRRVMREGAQKAKAAIGRQPFDADALRADFAANRQNWMEFSARFDESLVRGMIAISTEGHRRIAGAMPDPSPGSSDE